MLRFAVRVLLAVAFLAVGWIAGQAQTQAPMPDFEISVVYPPGPITFTCVRGCSFAVSQERNGVTTHGRVGSFSSGCFGPNAGPTCEYRTGGWVFK